MDWILGCFSCKCVRKSAIMVKEQQELWIAGVHYSASRGNKSNVLRQEIVQNKSFEEIENEVTEALADNMVQGRKWEEALHDHSNTNQEREDYHDRALNLHDYEKPHTLRKLFHDFQKVSDGFSVEDNQDTTFCETFLRRFDTEKGSLFDSCLRENVNSGQRTGVIKYSQDYRNPTYDCSPDVLTWDGKPTSAHVREQDTDMQMFFVKKPTILKFSGLQSSLNVSAEIPRKTTSHSDVDIEASTQLIHSFPDESHFNGENTNSNLARNTNAVEDEDSTMIKHEEMTFDSLSSSQLTNLNLLLNVTHTQSQTEKTFNSPSKNIKRKEHTTPLKKDADCFSEFDTPNSLFQSLSPPTSVHSEHSESSCFTETMSNEQTCSVSSASSSQVETPKSAESSRCIEDRPILGTVAAHWNNLSSSSTQKWWDGKGIPNSTNKYKEDQKVSWHATPFEVRLERALSKQKKTFQKKLFDGPTAMTNMHACPLGSST